MYGCSIVMLLRVALHCPCKPILYSIIIDDDHNLAKNKYHLFVQRYNRQWSTILFVSKLVKMSRQYLMLIHIGIWEVNYSKAHLLEPRPLFCNSHSITSDVATTRRLHQGFLVLVFRKRAPSLGIQAYFLPSARC